MRVEQEVTVLIKSFLRPKCVEKLVKSIRFRYPNIKIIIVDDSSKSYQFKTDENIEVYYLPFDSGLSKGRNVGVEAVETPYFVLCDDDLEFTDNTNLSTALRILERSELDILGGEIIDNGKPIKYFGNIEIKDDILYLQKGNRGVTPTHTLYDFVPNFFIARTESIEKHKWDDDLKVGEHTAFFTEHLGKLKVGYTRNYGINHQNRRGINNSEYEHNRQRASMLLDKWLKERGIKEIVRNN